MRRGSKLMCGGALAVLAVGLRAQSATEAPPASTLTISTHLVQITVIARDEHGGPAAGLRREDFSVRDQGRQRKVGIFEVESDGAAPASAVAAGQNVFSNRVTTSAAGRTAQGNVTVLLLDVLNTLSGSHAMLYEETPKWVEDDAALWAKRKVMEALEQTDGRDRVAVYALGGTLRLLCDFTCDRGQLLAAVKAYDPSAKSLRETNEPGTYHFPNTDGPGFDNAVNAGNRVMAGQMVQLRAEATLEALGQIARHVAAVPGRKQLLWVTADVPVAGQAAARVLAPANIAVYPVDARGLMAAQTLAEEAPRGMGSSMANTSLPPGIEAMQEMADATGGRAYVNTNDVAGAVRAVVDDRGARYTLGFYLDQASVDGKFHALKVHVARPGVTLEAPHGYFALDNAGAPPPQRAQWLAALASPYALTAIPLELHLEHVAGARSPRVLIAGSVGIAGMPLEREKTSGGTREATLDVALVEQDAAGVVLHQTMNHMKLKLTDAEFQQYARTGVAFRQMLEPQPRTAVVRVIVQEPASRQMGSVIVPLRQVM